ncbi:MAG: sigma-54-dependent Fis family transcriptional regulator [Deferribacteres bacterium]|nr:sigma-54-dependent Fis family transcriptional regulator [candidate division KSB1 bacterium]MCB9502219.1 sigma-54-dependent Fis family transcriptional regulator [Deferribacteres bacterium]
MRMKQYPTLPILVVDDESIMLNSYRRVLSYAGINNLILLQDSRNVENVLAKQKVELIILDLIMPYLSGEDILQIVANECPEIPVLIITGVREVETAVKCLRWSAYDYLVKPVDEDRLITAVKRAIEFREMQSELLLLRQIIFSNGLKQPVHFKSIISQNREMRRIFQYIEAVAQSRQPVMITGETGVGKEKIARAVHDSSGLPGRFVSIGIAGLEETVISDTLFGHIKGAFTGADNNRAGLVEKALNGTLFLDEIGDLNDSSQVKLLRLIQEQEYFPLGSDDPKRSHVRIVVATHRDLEKKVGQGAFRSDLFFRLKAHHVHLPPLRERLEDLPLLLDHFITMAAVELNKAKIIVTDELVALFASYHFPGNIRELKSIVFDAIALHKTKRPNMKTFANCLKGMKKNESFSQEPLPAETSNLFRLQHKLPSITQVNQMLVTEALIRANGNKTVAANMLGITRQTIIKYEKSEKK